MYKLEIMRLKRMKDLFWFKKTSELLYYRIYIDVPFSHFTKEHNAQYDTANAVEITCLF